jgi:DNA-binding response OmpR family regulator
MAAPHLLVVDDEAHVSLVIQHACERAGYYVTTARTLTEAREALASGVHVDLLLLDVMLPDGSGLDLLREIREGDVASEMPVVILTGAGFDQVLEGAQRYGARCVTKPFSPSKLRRLVGEILGGDTPDP